MYATSHHRACQEAITLLTQPNSAVQIQAVDSLERLQELWEIDKAAYQDCSLELDEFSQWWKHYELGSRVLIEDGRIIASIGIYPLPLEQGLAFAEGQIPESDLVPVSLEECDRQPQHCWYASGIVVAEDRRGGENSPLKPLLKLGLTYWLSSNHIAYPASILSIAEYEIGARLLDLFGFQKIREGSRLPDGCDLYQLTLESEAQARSMLRAKRLH